MQGDDIRNQRMNAQTFADRTQSLDAHNTLVLWVIAEQLFELRSLIAIQLENPKKDT